MPTKQRAATALCTGTALIVAGGKTDKNSTLKTVEVMNINSCQWSTAVDLPEPLRSVLAVVCGDHIYFLSQRGYIFNPSESPYSLSISALIQSCNSKDRNATPDWNRITAPPVGGKEFSEIEPTTAIYSLVQPNH